MRIELPVNILGQIAGDENNLRGCPPSGIVAAPSQPAGDPQVVEKAVRMLLKAKRPIIVAGDGIFWSKASAELRELVEMLSIPVITRRMGRGAVPEEHPLAFGGGFRRPIQMQSDLVVIIGLRMNILEGFGLPPRYPGGERQVYSDRGRPGGIDHHDCPPNSRFRVVPSRYYGK